jgi:glycosyltransferase involved in cell wall biosynthesis
MTDISVIIPTFNRLWCLPEVIQSCGLDSDACEIQTIVVDDGSTDGTWDWLQSQTGIVALRQSNWGKGNAVNKALSLARGEFVRFLDSDDLLPPGANAAQVAEARKTGSDVVAAGYIARYERSRIDSPKPWTICDDFIAQQIGECDSSHYSAYIFRKSFLEGLYHRQEFAFRDDRMFMIEVAIKEPAVAHVDMPCLIHRHHLRDRIQFQRGLVSDVTNWQELQMLTKTEELLRQAGQLDGRRKKAIAKVLWPLAHRIAATHLHEACHVVQTIRRLDPDFEIPQNGALGWLHRALGFRATQVGVRCVRAARNTFLDWTELRRPYSPPRD